MKIEDYLRQKSKIDALRQKKARAEGALEQTRQRLENHLGVPMREARGRILEMRRREEKLRSLVERQLREFSAEWSEKLEEVE